MLRIALTFLLILTSSIIAARADPGSDDEGPTPREVAVKMSAHIEKFKRYPLDTFGVGGLVLVQFEIDSKGRLHKHEVIRSSCFTSLDRAALDMLERAAPFPMLTVTPGKDRINFRLPVLFVKPPLVPAGKTPTPANAGCKPPNAEAKRLEREELERRLGLRTRS